MFPFRLIGVHLMCSGNIPSKIKGFVGWQFVSGVLNTYN